MFIIFLIARRKPRNSVRLLTPVSSSSGSGCRFSAKVLFGVAPQGPFGGPFGLGLFSQDTPLEDARLIETGTQNQN